MWFTFMLGMDVTAGEPVKETYDETMAASIASMHIETYDTHGVPYGQQCCKYSYRHILHLNLQSYKFVPRFQIRSIYSKVSQFIRFL